MGGRGNDGIAQSHEPNFKSATRARQACDSRCESKEGVPEEVLGDSDQLLNGDTECHVTEVTT